MSIQANFPAIAPSLLLDFANTKQLDNRITFTRSTPAVYYDGKTTAMAEQNLFLQSQTFTTTWIPVELTVTANTTTAPDGTATASTLTATAVNNPLVLQPKPFSTSGTVSVYLKKGTSNFGFIYIDSPNFIASFFNLDTGVVGSFSAPFTSISMVSVGNGWYRCVAVFSGISGSNIGFGVCDSSSAPACTIGRTIFAWGAQVEQRSTATAYTATTTQPITNYIPVLLSAGGNQARFDHNPTTGESLGLLIEEQRTNRILYSEQFENAAWSLYGSTITTNAIVSPSGLQNGEKIVETTANDIHRISQSSISVSASTAYTFTVYAKAGERTFIENRIYDGFSNVGIATFNLVNGTVSGVTGSASMTLVGNGWYRCILTATTSASSSTALALIYLKLNASLDTWTGNGYSGAFVWGAQLEQGSFATSYIATTSSSATRTADVAQMTGTNFSSWFNNAQGTFVATVSAGVLSNGARICKVSDTDANRLIDFFVSGTSQGIFSYQNGITSANFASGTIGTTKYLTAVNYATGNISALVNGGTVTTSTNAVVSSVANSTFAIGYDPTTGAQLSRPIAKIAYYPIQVTSANLQALTS
jgi:hypothetical protein